MPPGDPNKAHLIALSYPSPDAPAIHYGAQPPQLSGFTELLLMRDKSAFYKGPAYTFQQKVDKIVVVKAEDLPGAILKSKRAFEPSLKRFFDSASGRRGSGSFFKRQQSDWTQGEFAQPGEKPWYCFWNGTVLTGFLYLEQYQTGFHSVKRRGDSSEGQIPSKMPFYPKPIKIEEGRDSQNPIEPYCRQFQVLDNYQLNPVPRLDGKQNTVPLIESEPFEKDPKLMQEDNHVNDDEHAAEDQGPYNQKRDPKSACKCGWTND